MYSKHIFNDTDGLVLKSLRGAAALNPVLRIHAASKAIYNIERSPTLRVAVISGGGAGHEPAHAGYTGRGLLSACVSGDVFASPSASQILTCIKLAVAAQKTTDVLLVINNYTGDRLNFGLAAERAKVEITGVNVESVVVADDVSLLSKPSLVGARGLAGNILVCKILGAAAEAGLVMRELKVLGDAVVSCLASIGVGLGHCHVPGRGIGSESLKHDECELGLGLHNEPGVRRMSIGNPSILIREMLDQILKCDRAETKKIGCTRFLDSGDDAVLYINNLGGISTLEMGAIVDEVVCQLGVRGIHPRRILCASYMTSLNAPGFSISLLNISAVLSHINILHVASTFPIATPEDVLTLIDAPTDSSAWAGVRNHWPLQRTSRDLEKEQRETNELLSQYVETPRSVDNDEVAGYSWDTLGIPVAKLKDAINDACTSIIGVSAELTEFDTILGDGDCGETFSSGAKALIHAMGSPQMGEKVACPARFIAWIAEILVDSMGGTSGAICGLYLTALSTAFSASDPSTISLAPLQALQALSSYTPARPGDRTLVDALEPFCAALAAGLSFDDAVEAARKGAERTVGMKPRLGRAVYVGTRDDSEQGLPPDPGAWAVKVILGGLRTGFTRNP